LQRSRNNSFGLRVQDNANLTVKNSISSGNAFAGFSVVQVAGGPVALTLDASVASSNGTFGLVANGNGTTIARITNSTFTNNATGMQAQGTSQIVSAGNNFISGNNPDGAPTSTPGQQ